MRGGVWPAHTGYDRQRSTTPPGSTSSNSPGVDIGSAGTGGAAGLDGSDGTSSSFGTHCSAAGGSKSLGTGVNTFATSQRTGGAGGASASRDINITGQTGDDGFGVPTLGKGGRGGNAVFGFGGKGAVGTGFTAGGAAVGYGGGGGGASAGPVSTTGAAGGDGAPGVVIVTEFY